MNPSVRPRRARWLLALGAVLAALLVVEGLVRIRQWLKYGTTEVSFYRLTEDPLSGLVIPEPGHTIGPISIDSRGFRGPEVETPKPLGRLRVGFLGGSTTFCAEATSLEATWPHLVVERLRARDPDLTFDYVNAAAAGYSTQESLVNLARRLAPLEPDVIVIYHGTNDLTQDTRELATTAGLYDPEVKEEDWLGRYWLSWYLLKKNVLFSSRRGGADDRERLAYDPEVISPLFRARLHTLIDAARKVAPVVSVATFAQRTRREQTPEEQIEASSSSLYYMPYLDVEGILKGFEEYNRVIREVAQAAGAVLVEGESAIPGDAAHFNDSVHLTDLGLGLQAERVSKALLESPQYGELVESKRDGR